MKSLIVKEDVIKIIKNADVFTTYHEKDPIEEAIDRAIRATKRSIIYDIEILLPAQPRKKGKWLNRRLAYMDVHIATCDQCGKRMVVGNFCPNCGAKMEDEE